METCLNFIAGLVSKQQIKLTHYFKSCLCVVSATFKYLLKMVHSFCGGQTRKRSQRAPVLLKVLFYLRYKKTRLLQDKNVSKQIRVTFEHKGA